MFKIIQKASIEDSENCLSKLLINNFYENILSASYIEDELLSLIGRSLREEINQLKQTNQPQYFLNNSNIGKILEGLILKRDIQSFFNMILKGLIENLENGTENRNWNFDINLICEVITNFKRNDGQNNKIINNFEIIEIRLAIQLLKRKKENKNNLLIGRFHFIKNGELWFDATRFSSALRMADEWFKKMEK